MCWIKKNVTTAIPNPIMHIVKISLTVVSSFIFSSPFVVPSVVNCKDKIKHKNVIQPQRSLRPQRKRRVFFINCFIEISIALKYEQIFQFNL